MYRIDTPGSVSVMPAPAPAGTPGYFQDTAPGGGTQVSADWLNHIQEELAGLIEAQGVNLSKAQTDCLLKAIRKSIHSGDTDVIVSSQHEHTSIGSKSVTIRDCVQTVALASRDATITGRAQQVVGTYAGNVRWLLDSQKGLVASQGFAWRNDYIGVVTASSVGGNSVQVWDDVRISRITGLTPVAAIAALHWGAGDDPYWLDPIAYITGISEDGTKVICTVVLRNLSSQSWSGGVDIYVFPLYVVDAL